MSFEEKRAWTMAVVSVVAYVIYLVIVLGRVAQTPIAEVPYVATLLWTVGISIVVSIFIHIATAIASPREADRKDQRDKEINRIGEYIGQSFLVIGAVAAMIFAMAELDYFWIANVLYLAFALSAVVGSFAKIVAYRRGFQSW